MRKLYKKFVCKIKGHNIFYLKEYFIRNNFIVRECKCSVCGILIIGIGQNRTTPKGYSEKVFKYYEAI